MNTSYGYDAYRAHDLNISMRTSSGDVITMDFANHQSTSMRHTENNQGSQSSLTFSSMQSFQFKMETNGIDAQDQKEIDAFMEQAKPYIDNFLAELNEDAPNTPVTKLAQDIAGMFAPLKEKSDDVQAQFKNDLVKTFDDSLKAPDLQENIDRLFEESRKLLEKILKEFDELGEKIYA